MCNQDLNASNVEKNTPLHWACLNGHTEVNLVFTMSNLFHSSLFSLTSSTVQVVKKLILAGATVSVLNRSGSYHLNV